MSTLHELLLTFSDKDLVDIQNLLEHLRARMSWCSTSKFLEKHTWLEDFTRGPDNPTLVDSSVPIHVDFLFQEARKLWNTSSSHERILLPERIHELALRNWLDSVADDLDREYGDTLKAVLTIKLRVAFEPHGNYQLHLDLSPAFRTPSDLTHAGAFLKDLCRLGKVLVDEAFETPIAGSPIIHWKLFVNNIARFSRYLDGTEDSMMAPFIPSTSTGELSFGKVIRRLRHCVLKFAYESTTMANTTDTNQPNVMRIVIMVWFRGVLERVSDTYFVGTTTHNSKAQRWRDFCRAIRSGPLFEYINGDRGRLSKLQKLYGTLCNPIHGIHRTCPIDFPSDEVLESYNFDQFDIDVEFLKHLRPELGRGEPNWGNLAQKLTGRRRYSER